MFEAKVGYMVKGRSASEREFADSLGMAGLDEAKKIARDAMQGLSCKTHGEGLHQVIFSNTPNGLQIKAKGCCQDFVDQAEGALTRALK